ncbi:hypothetical protein [Micromonospora eburnea]|uniref:Uncharacterized protein n=1 Tax=Micromonospora eburnea TaxID=227316 RepID=A0A1C6UAV3_9ACTN|nr:hypothetical protein [Micromonospora eburnea]SCL51147.1 hypothetical protein GA0070604_2294 [Micromonospora eburnea]
MKGRSRGLLIGGLVVAMVATLGGMEALPGRDSGRADQAAGGDKDESGGLLSRLGDAARGLADGGEGRARPEVVGAGLFQAEKPLAGKRGRRRSGSGS